MRRENYYVFKRKNLNNLDNEKMSPLDFIVFTLLGLLALVGANAVLWSVAKKAERVKFKETQVLIISVIAYATYMVFLTLFYSYGTPIA